MGKRKETLARERRENIGDQLASLLMRLYIDLARYDKRLDVRDFSNGTWTMIAGALLDAGWRPPLGWETGAKKEGEEVEAEDEP